MIRKMSEMFPYKHGVRTETDLDAATISTKIIADFGNARSEIKERIVAAVLKSNEMGAGVNDIVVVNLDPTDTETSYHLRNYTTEVRKGALLRLAS